MGFNEIFERVLPLRMDFDCACGTQAVELFVFVVALHG